MITWGLFIVYAKTLAMELGMLFLAVNIIMGFAYSTQSETNIMVMFDVWGSSFKIYLLHQ